MGEEAVGDKMILRLMAGRLGLDRTKGRKKRAMQFGARSAKMEVVEKEGKGKQVVGGEKSTEVEGFGVGGVGEGEGDGDVQRSIPSCTATAVYAGDKAGRKNKKKGMGAEKVRII